MGPRRRTLPFGKYLRVDVNGHVPPVAEVLREFPARRVAGEHGEVMQGMAVRLRLQRQRASAELDLGRRRAVLSE